MKRWMVDIYVDVLKKNHKVKAIWIGDMLIFTTYRELGPAQIHGHTIYIKTRDKLTKRETW